MYSNYNHLIFVMLELHYDRFITRNILNMNKKIKSRKSCSAICPNVNLLPLLCENIQICIRVTIMISSVYLLN